MLPSDTTPEAAALQMAVLRRLSPGQRIELALEMSQQAREISAEGWRRRHPGSTRAEAERAIARLLLGEELARRVWPDPAP